MRALSFGIMLTFGLAWLATLAADAALPMVLAGMPSVTGPAASTALDWLGTQTASAMALSAAAYLCFSGPGARWWGALALIAILPLMALAVVQFDPRIVARLQADVGPMFDQLRAAQPMIRLFLFTGISLIGASCMLSDGTRWGPRLVALAFVMSIIAVIFGPPSGTAVFLALPALVLLAQAALKLAEQTHPAASYILMGTVCVLVGAVLVVAGDSPRQDVRAAFVPLPLFAAFAYRLRPKLPQAVLWAHAVLMALGLAYLAPGFAQFGDVRSATSFAEIALVVQRAEMLRTGVGAMLGVLVLLGLVAFRRHRVRPERKADAADQG